MSALANRHHGDEACHVGRQRQHLGITLVEPEITWPDARQRLPLECRFCLR